MTNLPLRNLASGVPALGPSDHAPPPPTVLTHYWQLLLTSRVLNWFCLFVPELLPSQLCLNMCVSTAGTTSLGFLFD